MKEYAALMIDLKKSKSYSTESRNKLQQKILETIQKLNTLFSTTITKEVEFSAEDEIQGLFSSPMAAYLYLRFFQLLTFPLELVLVVGILLSKIQVLLLRTVLYITMLERQLKKVKKI